MTLSSISENRKANNLAIFIIWLVHVSAVIGIFLGYREWFITKTPMNLLLLFIVLWLFHPINSKRTAGIFGVAFAIGFLAELIGVNTGLLFGSYEYGDNLGLKIGGVPLLIGVNWALLVFVTAEIFRRTNLSIWLKSALAAGLMVLLDAFIEPLAPSLDFWSWTYGHPPAFNYITWFIVAYGLVWLYFRVKITGNLKMSWNIYLSQLFFFGFLNIERVI